MRFMFSYHMRISEIGRVVCSFVPVRVVNTMHLGILFSLSKINFFLFKYVICCITFRSNEINCLHDLRESKVK